MLKLFYRRQHCKCGYICYAEPLLVRRRRCCGALRRLSLPVAEPMHPLQCDIGAKAGWDLTLAPIFVSIVLNRSHCSKVSAGMRTAA